MISCKKRMPSAVVLYFPSTGLYYSPWFVSDTSCLWSKGMWLCNQCLAMTFVLQMLPATSLWIQKGSGLPGADGQLHSFTDIYWVHVHSICNPILTLLPVFQGIHVSDSNICIPPDFVIGQSPCMACNKNTTEENNALLRKALLNLCMNLKSIVLDASVLSLGHSLLIQRAMWVMHLSSIVHWFQMENKFWSMLKSTMYCLTLNSSQVFVFNTHVKRICCHEAKITYSGSKD